jgi:hypothetical protein
VLQSFLELTASCTKASLGFTENALKIAVKTMASLLLQFLHEHVYMKTVPVSVRSAH